MLRKLSGILGEKKVVSQLILNTNKSEMKDVLSGLGILAPHILSVTFSQLITKN